MISSSYIAWCRALHYNDRAIADTWEEMYPERKVAWQALDRPIRAGDFVRSVKTGEFRVVVECNKDLITFAGDPKWYSIADWRNNARLG